ncbi:MAG: YciI family protein [Armatimonas sp.]
MSCSPGTLANIQRLAKEGKLSVAGPFDKNDQNLRGLFILNVKTVDEAKRLVDTDPTIRAGVFVVDLVPWYGSAALMTVNRDPRENQPKPAVDREEHCLARGTRLVKS